MALARISSADFKRLGVKGLNRKARSSSNKGRIAQDAPEDDRVVVIHLPLSPRPKERPRTFQPQGQVERAFLNAHGDINKFRKLLAAIKHKTLTPKSTSNFEKQAAQIALLSMAGKGPFTCPVEIHIKFIIKGDEGMWPVASSDADLDNLEKAIFDAWNGIVYEDDRLIVRKTSEKACGSEAGIEATIRQASV